MAEDSRERILESIRSGLCRAGDSAHHKERIATPQFGMTPGEANKTRPAAEFAEELLKVSGFPKILAKTGEIRDFILEFADKNKCASFAIWQTGFLESLKLRRILTDRGLSEAHAEDKFAMAGADFGVTEADYGIANTGTLVLLSGKVKPRTTSLIPPVHIAVLKSDNIVPNIHELFRKLASAAGQPPACMTFITGPSRTADIELNLTLGVHGPKELYALILDKN